jgi:DNA-binding PadR family transcriptional regulator
LQEIKLTPTSYIVLGLLEQCAEATPYDLKQIVGLSLGNFWSLQHAQLYSEPERLANAGYLKERREEGGRRRRHYSITARGAKALEEWRRSPAERLYELRDLGLLKVFFGADPEAVAEAQLEAHRGKLAEYEALQRFDEGREPRGPWLTLEAGIGHERETIRFWESLRAKAKGRRPRK